mmetsp:Transcript_53608/g.96173  ORF Transcript_53608/g.96173 Transcript_53608/m.96173 type:complete len:92 (-) Transcript_53608:36-311(-)
METRNSSASCYSQEDQTAQHFCSAAAEIVKSTKSRSQPGKQTCQTVVKLLVPRGTECRLPRRVSVGPVPADQLSNLFEGAAREHPKRPSHL